MKWERLRIQVINKLRNGGSFSGIAISLTRLRFYVGKHFTIFCLQFLILLRGSAKELDNIGKERLSIVCLGPRRWGILMIYYSGFLPLCLLKRWRVLLLCVGDYGVRETKRWWIPQLLGLFIQTIFGSGFFIIFVIFELLIVDRVV